MRLQDNAILVVEDEPILREIAAKWLTQIGCRVFTAENGAVAMEVVKSVPVDLIVSDIHMPVMDGLAFLRAIRTGGRYVPSLVFVTGFSDVSPRDAYDIGAEALLPKPYNREELTSQIQRSLTEREELWRAPAKTESPPLLRAVFESLGAALKRGLIAFGRGGFCLSSITGFSQGGVRLAVDFQQDHQDVVGDGIVRWVERNEQMIGVEIISLEDSCRKWVAGLATENRTRSFIPRTARAATAHASRWAG